MTTAFVLWGGGSLGAAQVGMLRALTARGVRADVVVGASSGAINGVCYAARPDLDGVDELAQHWLQISQHDVFPLTLPDSLRVIAEDLPWRPVRGVFRALGVANHAFPFNPVTVAAAMMGRCNHLVDSGRFERFLHRMLPVENLEHARLPIEVLTTDLHTGDSVPLTQGPAVSAVMASTAIPAVYPAVEHCERTLVDGEVANGTSLDHAINLGANEVYLLAPKVSCQLSTAPSSVLGMALHAYYLLSEQRIAASIEQAQRRARLYRPPSPSTEHVLPIDFTHGAELIDTAAHDTDTWLRTTKCAEADSDHDASDEYAPTEELPDRAAAGQQPEQKSCGEGPNTLPRAL